MGIQSDGQWSTGGPSLLDQLKADEQLMSNRSAKDGILEMELLFTLLEAYKVLDKVRQARHVQNLVSHSLTDFLRHVLGTRSRLLYWHYL